MRRFAWWLGIVVLGAAFALVLYSPSPPSMVFAAPKNTCRFLNNDITCTGRSELIVTAADGTKLLVKAPFEAKIGLQP